MVDEISRNHIAGLDSDLWWHLCNFLTQYVGSEHTLGVAAVQRTCQVKACRPTIWHMAAAENQDCLRGCRRACLNRLNILPYAVQPQHGAATNRKRRIRQGFAEQ